MLPDLNSTPPFEAEAPAGEEAEEQAVNPGEEPGAEAGTCAFLKLHNLMSPFLVNHSGRIWQEYGVTVLHHFGRI